LLPAENRIYRFFVWRAVNRPRLSCVPPRFDHCGHFSEGAKFFDNWHRYESASTQLND